MTDTYTPAPFTIAPLAPLTQAPALAPSDSGSLAPIKPVGSHWNANRRETHAKVRAERRNAIERARHSAEAGWSRPGVMTKAERLAAAKAKSKGTQEQTGSGEQRKAVISSVQRAMEKVLGVPSERMPETGISSDKEMLDANTRLAIDKLRHYHPGKSIGEIVAQAEKFDAAMKDDPVHGRQMLIEHYAMLAPEHFAEFKPAEKTEGLRGSLQRARQGQSDNEELRDAHAKWGVHLPHILQQLERFDSSLRENPGLASARIATSHGAPATERQIEPYKQARAQKDAAKAHAQRQENIHRGVQLAIEHGHVPGDEASLNEIAAVMKDPRFQHHPTDGLDTLRRAAAIVTHPEHKWLTGKRSNKDTASDAGSKSISGNRAATGTERYGSGGSTRAAIQRAMGS